MKSVQTHPTPQHVYEAIQVVAGWCQEIGAVEVLVAPTGGAAFHAERYFDQFSRACAEIERLEAERDQLLSLLASFRAAHAALRAAQNKYSLHQNTENFEALHAAEQAYAAALGRLVG